MGYGENGSKIAFLAKAFGMNVVAMRRNTAYSENDPFVDTVSFISSMPDTFYPTAIA